MKLLLEARMAGFKDFREIVAWQLANELKLKVDRYLARPEFRRRAKFCEQIDDAARSGPRNIAEGFARFKHKEFAQFDTSSQRQIHQRLNGDQSHRSPMHNRHRPLAPSAPGTNP